MQSAKCRWSHSVIYIPEQKMLNVKHNDAPILAQNIMLLLLQVFLEYADIDGATKARTGMNGRKFGGNQVVAVFYPENKFAQGDYEG